MPRSLLRGFVVTGGALALVACDKAATAPQALGSSIQVQGNKDSPVLWPDPDYAGTVTVDSNPLAFVKSNGTQILGFHVEVNATKGDIPTDSWSIETENAIPVTQQGIPEVTKEGIPEADIAQPPLGPKVSGNAKGYIRFNLPQQTIPTVLDLLSTHDPSSKPLARWSIGNLPSATPLPSTAQTTSPSPMP